MRRRRWFRAVVVAPLVVASGLCVGCPVAAPEGSGRELPATTPRRVRIDTALGSITLELDADRAPLTTENFLRYVREDFYTGGEFFRTVTATNQPRDTIRIAVIQGGASPGREGEAYDPVPLERTRDTRLRHLDGVISMARAEPDTATHSFFICIGDQPELDFGGRRNPDGQGFAAFGRVVEGMDVVRAIHCMPADGQRLDPPIPILRATSLN
jgi:peptidyl-prolyl cis-trans isomerase A (cyclophilin A)